MASQFIPSRLLTGLGDPAVSSILASARTAQADENQMIFNYGAPATQLFVVRCGRVRYFRPTKDGADVLLDLLTDGDVFGLGSLLRERVTYVGSAQALSECNLLVWDKQIAANLSRQYPQLAENALRIVLAYLKSFAERHISTVTKPAAKRVARVLLELAQCGGHVSANGVTLTATHKQLSIMAHTSRLTTSRVLDRWKRKGFVSTKRQQVWVLTPEALLDDD
jgi:CRP-like cAMP-binding protein